MKEILDEARTRPQLVKTAPHTTPVRRLDDVKAARELDLAWKPPGSEHDGELGIRALQGRPALRVWNALFYSLDGFRAAFSHEDAFRQEVLLALILIPLALLLPASGIGKALMIASVLLVLIVELLNSAIEAVVDRISLEHHVLAKRAKDIGSAAVMLSLIAVPPSGRSFLNALTRGFYAPHARSISASRIQHDFFRGRWCRGRLLFLLRRSRLMTRISRTPRTPRSRT